MELQFRWAGDGDLDLLADWNNQLIQDEGHRDQMAVPELRERMRRWLAGEYRAVIFLSQGEPAAYGLYRETDDEVYLRQLFVRRDKRRAGIGRQAMDIFLHKIWPQGKRRTVDVLTKNEPAVQFWRAVGYEDYSLTLENRL